MSDPMKIMRQITEMDDRLNKLKRGDESTFDAFERILDEYEQNKKQKQIDSPKPDEPKIETSKPVVESKVESVPPQTLKYRFKTLPEMNEVMTPLFGNNWRAMTGLMTDDVLTLVVGKMPDDEKSQTEMSKVYNMYDDRNPSLITYKGKRVPFTKLLIEEVVVK